MKRIATLLTIAGITLVGYTGAVYSVLSHDTPDNTSEPVYSIQEATPATVSADEQEPSVTLPEKISANQLPITIATIATTQEKNDEPENDTRTVHSVIGLVAKNAEERACITKYYEARYKNVVTELTLPDAYIHSEYERATIQGDVCRYFDARSARLSS